MPTLSIDWERSPRIIIVDAPDTEISAQQIVDTCRDAEDDVENTSYPRLVEASGKEDLGGGTTVGITVALQNAKIGFESYINEREAGTVTTPDTTGKTLTDSAATFVTNLVAVGDLVENKTDHSDATVIEVVSETELLTTGLAGGTDNQFDSADVYDVMEIQTTELTGGNVVAVDDTGASIEPVLPMFGNYTIVSKASTGTLSEQTDIRHASFDGGVHVDVTSSTSGSAYPAFNSANPGNNWVDAAVVNAREGFNHYFVERSATLDNAVDFTDAAFTGKSIIDTVLAVPSGTTVDKAEFTNLSLEGSLGETTIMQHCFLGETNPLLDVRGVVEDCSIGPSPLTLGGTSAQTVRFVRCNGAGEDTSPATVNGGGDGPKFDVQDYTGALKVANKTGAAFWDIHVTGELIIDSTCVAGVIRATGSGNLTDDSGNDCTVIDEMLKPTQITELWRLQGLEFGNPMTVTTTERSLSDQSISLALTGDGITTQTVTRQTDQTLIFDAPLTADLLDDSDTGATPTFTRASTGTYRAAGTGLITSAAIDAPRFELGGLLIEGARTNELYNSEDFSTTWTVAGLNAVINTDQAVSPDGATTADEFLDDATFGVHSVRQGRTVLNATQYCLSVYAKDKDIGEIALQENSSGVGKFFDIAAGTVGGNLGSAPDGAGIRDIGNGWYRCWIIGTTTGTSGQARIYTSNGSENTSYSGSGQGCYLWGAQLEAGDGPTSYIPTTIGSASRSADFLSYDDEIVIDALGSMIASVSPSGTAVRDAVLVNITDQLVGPLYMLDDTTQKAATGDGTTVNSVALTVADNTVSKVASRWSTAADELEVIANGTAAGTSAYDDAFTRTIGTLYIGSDSTGNHINGNIKAVKIYNVDRGTAQLQVDTG